MECSGCGNPNAYRLRARAGFEVCDRCGRLSNVRVSDVYFREPYLDPHLIDTKKPEQKDGVWISSREQKARIMRELGVREAGDRKHGARDFNRTAWRNFREKSPQQIDVRE